MRAWERTGSEWSPWAWAIELRALVWGEVIYVCARKHLLMLPPDQTSGR
jgi:hypothetical protein